MECASDKKRYNIHPAVVYSRTTAQNSIDNNKMHQIVSLLSRSETYSDWFLMAYGGFLDLTEQIGCV